MSDLLAPWEPSTADRFDLRKVGHLLRRAGYGASLVQRRELVRQGVEAALDFVFGAPAATPAAAAEWHQDVRALHDIVRVREFRVWLALTGDRPLQLRMSACWHGHFATSNRKVQDPDALLGQWATYDRLGLGPFPALAQAMVRDPALLRWLDNDTNGKDRPNENFAREWLELFTLGRGNYGESDVREAARALTGFGVTRGAFAFVGAEHDRGEKTFLGQRGAWDGGDVARIAAEHPASARFLADRLLRWFVHPEPRAEWVDALAACYLAQGRDLGRTLRVLLRSQLFFGADAWRSAIKSPSELLLGLARAIGAPMAPRQAAQWLAELGEAWCEPPTVEGWPGDRAWLSTATFLLRNRAVAAWLLGQAKPSPEPVLAALFARSRTPPQRMQLALDLVLDGAVSDESRSRLLASVTAIGEAADAPARVVHAATLLPEFQLR